MDKDKTGKTVHLQKFVNIEEFSDIIGGHGRWQMYIFTFFFVVCFPHCMHILIMTFFAPNVNHWCARPDELIAQGVTLDQWKDLRPPTQHPDGEDFCHVFLVPNETDFLPTNKFELSTNKCHKWEYDEFYAGSLTSEWDLVCGNEWMVPLAKMVYMAGFLVSVSLSGQASDRFGRKLVVVICLLVFFVASFLTLLSQNIFVFITIRFFVAIGITSVFTMGYVILTEVVSTSYRSVYCFTFKLGWVVGYMLLPGIAYFLPNWRDLQIAITAPFLVLLCVFWVVPETPRWLIITGNYKEAEKVLLRAAKVNGKDLTKTKEIISSYLQKLSKVDQGIQHKGTFFDLLRTPNLRRITLFMYFCWFIISYIYYALSFNTNELGGNPYLTFFLSGAVELPSILVFLVISKYIGHRNSLVICNVVGGLCLILMIVIQNSSTWVIITAAMAGKFFTSASFDIVYIYSAEVFPTVVRNVGVGTCSTWARIGALVAPYIRQLGDSTHPSVPLAVPGVLSVISGIMLLWLPDTKGKKLPDTLEEGERFGQRKRCRNFPPHDSPEFKNHTNGLV